MKKRIVCVLLSLMMLVSLIPNAALNASAASRSTSEKAIALLKEIEGFSKNAYEDNGQWSIGYGTPAEKGDTITEEEADTALREQLKTIDKAVSVLSITARREFTQNEHDALALFSYNCGTAWTTANGRFRQSIIDGDTGNDFLYNICLWANVGSAPSKGLLNRRLAEANLYLNGVYSATAPSNYTYVLLDANGGSVGEDGIQGYNKNVPVAIKAVPTLKDSRFMGWYTRAEGGTYVTVLDESTAGQTLYAHWQANDTGVENGRVVGTAASYNLSAAQAASLNVYETPDTTAKVTKTLLKTATLNVVAEYIDSSNVKWVKLKTGGWVSLGNVEEPVTLLNNVTVTVTVDSVNVREKAGVSASHKIVKRVSLGEKLTISQVTTVSGSQWGLCEEGWIALMYTDYDDAIQQKDSVSTEVIATGTVVCSSILNVRSGAGTTKKKVGTIAAGTKVAIYEITEVSGHKWGRISAGWICLDYVELDTEDKTDAEDSTSGGTSSGSTSDGSTSGSESAKYLYAMTNAQLVVYDADGNKTDKVIMQGQVVKVYALGSFEDENVIIAQIDEGYVLAKYLTIAVNSEKYVTNSEVQVYSTAGGSTNGKTLAEGTEVIVTKMRILDTQVWVYVKEVSGWIDAELLNQSTTEDKEEETPGQEEEDGKEETSTPSGAQSGVVCGADAVNVRSSAGVRYDNLVTTLKRGTKVNVYEVVTKDGARWGRIDQGWISLQYVDLNASSGGESTSGGSSSTGSYATGFVSSSVNLNVRTGPGTGYTKITSLEPGTEVRVYEQELSKGMIWGRIDQGWVCMSYVTMTSTGGSTGTSGSTEEGVMGTIARCFYAVNVRSAPGTGNALVGKILVGSRVEIYEQKQYGGTTWGRVDQGWISMDYVLLDSELPSAGEVGGGTATPEEPQPSVPSDALYTGTVWGTNSLNVRSAASTKASQSGTLKRGDTVVIYETAIAEYLAWGRTDKGWICLVYVDLVPCASGAIDARVVQTIDTVIRSGAGAKYEKVGTYEKATVVNIYETSGDWARTDKGWVNVNNLLG